jgi:2-oxoglutarate ferredoxin oxidoreductase subunit beta
MQLRMEHGKPLLFGKDNKKGIRFNPRTAELEVVTVGKDGVTEADVLVHDMGRQDPTIAFMLANLAEKPGFPTPIGIFRDVRRPTADEITWEIIGKTKKGDGSLEKLLAGPDTWTIR